MRAPDRIYQLKITLKNVRPPIWRRILVSGKTALPELHFIIQAVMGWHNCHLHSFEDGEVSYGERDTDFGLDELEDERRVKLQSIALAVGSKFEYLYDFGDGWQHTVLVEKVLTAAPGGVYPVCITGKRACPPEDCGGAWGYVDFLEAISNPEHENHDEMQEWIGEGFDSEAFDLNVVNAMLSQPG